MKTLLSILLMLLFTLSSYAQSLYQQGMRAYNNEDYKVAIKLLTKVIEADEGSVAFAYNFRGEARQILGDNEEALKDYNKAIEINPNYAMAYQNRGMLRQSHTFDYLGALKDYNMAIRLDAKFELAYFNRASLKYSMGDFKGALLDYKNILKYFNPNHEEVKKYIAQIEGNGNDNGVVAEKNISDENTKTADSTTKTNTTKPLVDYDSVSNGITTTTVQHETEVETKTEAEIPTSVTTTTNTKNESGTDEIYVKEDADLKIFWFSPNPDEIPEKGMYADDEMLTIKLKAFSSHPLDADNFTVNINGAPAKSYKFNEIQLTGGPHHFTYINTIKLEPETNRIKVRVSNDAGSQYSRELKVIYNPRKPICMCFQLVPKR